MLNAEFISKKIKKYGDQWEARLSAMENVQDKLIQEMRGQLARLTSLFEDMTVHPQSPITLAKSTGFSTIRPEDEPFATWN